MNRSDRAHLRVAALSHPGSVRKSNEDRYAVTAFRQAGRNGSPVLLAVLADGIGGHRAGEVAAEMGVEMISQTVAASDGLAPQAILNAAITTASQAIFTRGQQDEAARGMGATCACALVIQDRLYTASVGDSRIYLYRDGKLRQVSTDHTWVQEALEKGFISPEQARGHPNAHVIRRFLGAPTPPEVDFRLRLKDGEGNEASTGNQGLRLSAGDRILLCSDGLTDLVSNAEISRELEVKDLAGAVQALLNLALERGGHDNTTLVALEMLSRKEMAAILAAPAMARRRALTLGCAAVLLIALFTAGAYLGREKWMDLLWPPTPQATYTLPSQLLTALPGRTSTSAPAYPPPFASPTPRAAAPTQGPTFTPWPTNTLPGYP